jgi:tetratricopeptide (TPR) repeat protein
MDAAIARSQYGKTARLAALVLRSVAEGGAGSDAAFAALAEECLHLPILRAIASFHAGRRDRVLLDRAIEELQPSDTVFTRSAFLYFEGLLLDARGEAETAARYYRRAAGCDPSLYWPSVLASRCLLRGAQARRTLRAAIAAQLSLGSAATARS